MCFVRHRETHSHRALSHWVRKCILNSESMTQMTNDMNFSSSTDFNSLFSITRAAIQGLKTHFFKSTWTGKCNHYGCSCYKDSSTSLFELVLAYASHNISPWDFVRSLGYLSFSASLANWAFTYSMSCCIVFFKSFFIFCQDVHSQ